MKYSYVYVFFLVFLLISCDTMGPLSLTNGYEHDEVRVHGVYEYNKTLIDGFHRFGQGQSIPVAARQVQFEHIIAIRIETVDGTVLAEYTPEYLEYIRKAYGRKRNQSESWIFTEKGLFLKTKEIVDRYRLDQEKIIEYYNSDEAVQDKQAMLEAGR